MGVGQPATVDVVPAVVAGLMATVEEVDLVAASTDRDPRRGDSPRGCEVAWDPDRKGLRDRFECAGGRSVLAGVWSTNAIVRTVDRTQTAHKVALFAPQWVLGGTARARTLYGVAEQRISPVRCASVMLRRLVSVRLAMG
jgi:hypothetical protein